MPLSPEQLAKRDGKITGSFVPWLMAGHKERIYSKWLELLGDPAFVPEDTTNNWAMHYGGFVEPFALRWHERRTGRRLSHYGEVKDHPTRPFVCSTVDAYREDDRCVLDCKAINSFVSIDETVSFYCGQLVVLRACFDAMKVALLVVHGGGEPQEVPVTIDGEFERRVWDKIDAFWDCVTNLREPVEPAIVAPIVPPDQMRSINFDNQSDVDAHNWSAEMIEAMKVWSLSEATAKVNADAKVFIKELLPADVGKVTLANIIVSRSRSNAISIKHARRS